MFSTFFIYPLPPASPDVVLQTNTNVNQSRKKPNLSTVKSYTSLRNLLTRRISIEVLIYSAILSGLVGTVLVTSIVRLDNQQVQTWLKTFPPSLLPHLVESDNFSIRSKAKLLESTNLFDVISIRDTQGNKILLLPENADATQTKSIAIRDSSGFLWGTFEYRRNQWHLWTPLLVTGALLLAGLIIMSYYLRRRLSMGLALELGPFNRFLAEVAYLANNFSTQGRNVKERFETFSAAQHTQEEAAMNEVILTLLNEIEEREDQLVSYTRDVEEERFLDELAKTAAMVSHDIRSPLAALQMMYENLTQVPESTRVLIRESITRIQDISNTLESKHKHIPLAKSETTNETAQKMHPELLSTCISSVVSEKRVQWEKHTAIKIKEHIEPDARNAFARISTTEFQRVLSNLINNAIEAMNTSGTVNIRLKNDENDWAIIVSDHGKGMSEAIISQLGEFGATFEKEHGTGLGLYHAIGSIKKWHGSIQFDSKEGQGTHVFIRLPKSRPPRWFASKIDFAFQSDVIILDDDPSIHKIWSERLQKFPSLRLFHFYSSKNLSKWLEGERTLSQATFLCDYELARDEDNGLDFLAKLSNNSQRFLITSHDQDENIRKRCLRLEIKLLPKSLAPFVMLSTDTQVPRKSTSSVRQIHV